MFALANQQIFPVFCACAERNMGSGRIMGFINDIAPSPLDRPAARLEGEDRLTCDANDATTMFIYKTTSEPRVGNVSYFKIYSGVLNHGDELINQENDGTERFNQLFEANGKNRTTTDQVMAGDLGVTVKLKDSHTNNTLNTKGTTRKIDKIHYPDPRIREAA